VIGRFLASWALFAHAYVTAWLIGIVLSLLGVLVVARDQIFLGAAVSQAATLGIALALVLGDVLPAAHLAWLRSDSVLSVMAVSFAVLAALLTARRSQSGSSSHEALTGWVFLGSASLAVLLVAHSPHGLAEIQRLLSSSLIGATASDVWVFGVCTAGTVVALGVAHRRVLLLVMDPAMALAAGMRVTLWAVGLTLWLGLVVGLSLRVSGTLYTVGCLVLPALVAKNLCREVRPLWLVSPLVALSIGVLGCVLADATDAPPAQMTVALLSLTLMLAWLLRWLRRSATTS
jgi:ABC-type Mn2+/Zn2+ transport system permease subunit